MREINSTEYWFDKMGLGDENIRTIEKFATKNRYGWFDKNSPYSMGYRNQYLVLVAPWNLGILWKLHSLSHRLEIRVGKNLFSIDDIVSENLRNNGIMKGDGGECDGQS